MLCKVNEDGSLSEVASNGGGSADYSTDEVVIGKWIDGKPLYRKVFIIPESNWAVNNTFAPLNIDFDFSDKTFIQASGSISRTDGFEHQIGSYYSTLAVRRRKTNPFEIWCNKWETSTSQLARVYLIVEYTKTTD